jgi:hypothetical protein
MNSMRIPTGVVVVSICCALLGLGDVLTIPPMPTTPKEKTSEPDRMAIEALVAQLRSPNKDPNPKLRNGYFKFPEDFDFRAQEGVEAARQKLLQLSTDAFPVLIEHLNDKGYCRSVEGAVLSGHSVGRECFEIIEEQVVVSGMSYKSRKGSDGEWHVHWRYFTQFSDGGKALYTAEGMRRWWKEHKHQSLREMQIEAVQWGIDREQKIGFRCDKDKEEYLHPLQAKLKDLRCAPGAGPVP